MSLDTFEQSLLTELRYHVATRGAQPNKRRRRAAWIAVPSTVAAGVAVAIGLSLAQPSAAFAVEKQSDGDITVTINRFDDAQGLEDALAADGVTAVVDYTPVADVPPDGQHLQSGQDDGGPSFHSEGGSETAGNAATTCAPAGVASSASSRTDGKFSLTIPASAADSDAVLHISLGGSAGPDQASSLAIRWTC